MFVVDASDLLRIDESRKVLEELLAHDKVAGKPLLVLANKQDREGALDEIDIVERLNLERLVNQQKCPTMVETCSAAGPPSGRRPQLDPGILDGYRWLLRRIISEYDKLNTRVERDSEEQRVANEAARQEWLRRQDTEQQVESLPSEYEDDPFKPISTLVTSDSVKEAQRNGHAVQLETLTSSVSDDSPDGSSHTVGEGIYIPLHSPEQSPPPVAPDVSAPQPPSVVMAVREQFEWKMRKQKKKLLLRRTNRTAPTSASSVEAERVLPPLKESQTCPWARPGTAKSLPSQGWGLSMSLEEVNPPLRLQVLSHPRQLVSSQSNNDNDDDDDVVICTTAS